MAKNQTKEIDKKLQKFDNRGIQTLFRTLSRNHYNLLRMVDNKAGIIIAVNSIIISLSMGAIYIGSNSPENNVGNSQIIFIIYSCIASMTVALISMLPYRYRGKQFKNSTYIGSLYAQNFSMMTLKEFKANIFNTIETGANLYEEMINDIYFLGKYIAWKQKLVIVSFVIFLLGLLGSAITNYKYLMQ